MSQMQRCEQGHFYDASRHRRCPACGIPGLDVGYTVPATAAYEPTQLPPARPPANGGRTAPAAAGAEGPTQRLNPTMQPDAPTIAFWHKPKRAGAEVTPASPDDAPIDPVVGWLVAIEGPAKGRDFRVYSEGNEIGRANQFRIVIKDDPAIAQRDPHAIVTFDPRSPDAAYYIQAGGRHLLYVTRQGTKVREVVLAPTRLNAYDIIELGKTKLLFVPLCNEWFRWQLSEEEDAPQQ